jgi:protein tyrosine kinase modulator
MNSRRTRSLADYLRAARRRKLVLFIPTLVLAVSSGVALKTLPNLYESTAGLTIVQAKTDGGADLAGRLNEFRQNVTTREVLEEIISKYAPQDGPPDAAVLLMRDRIGIKLDANRYSERGALTVSYRATDPETARSVTEALTDRLVAQRSNAPSSSTSEADVLRNRATSISVQLRNLEEKNPWLPGIRSDISVVSQPPRSYQPSAEAMRSQNMSIEGLKDQLYKFQQQLADVNGRITTQRQVVDQQKKGSSLRDNPTYAALISKRAELQGQRDTLINRQELTDKHPRVLGINDQIAAINRQIDELRQQDVALVSQSPEARELAALESERNRVKIDLEVTGRELARRSVKPPVQAAAPESTPGRRDPVALRLTQEYLGLKRSYKEVTASLQDIEARLKPSDGANLTQLRVLEPANLPEAPVSPNRLLLISVAAVVGLALGAAWAFFAESGRRKLLQDARDIEYYARLPLLAEIPRTSTQIERRRTWWRVQGQLVLACVISIVVTFALSKIFIASDIFELIIKK